MESVEKIVYIREYSESAGMFLNRYVSEVTIVNNDIISYRLNSSKPYVFNNNDKIRNIRIIDLLDNYRITSLCCSGYIFYNKSDALRIKNYLINKAINNIKYDDIDLNSFNVIEWI